MMVPEKNNIVDERRVDKCSHCHYNNTHEDARYFQVYKVINPLDYIPDTQIKN